MHVWEGVTERHLRRKAFLYRRQSTPEQVRVNVGSGLVQMSQVELIKPLGWREDQIVIVDDLGVTGTLAEIRQGWQELYQAIESEEAGLVAFSESSRAARSEEDMARLVNLCEIYDVLILLEGQLLDPQRPDHRLILGVRAAVDVFDNKSRTKRLLDAKRALVREKHKQVSRPPRGYVGVGGRVHPVQLHPDEAVRQALVRVFDTFDIEGTALRTVRRLRAEGARLPNTRCDGSVEWVEVTTSRVFAVLHNAFYAGYYVYGKTRMSPRFGRIRTGKHRGRPLQRRMPRDKWDIIPNHHGAIIEPVRYWRNQDRLKQNNFKVRQPALRGPALLQGLIRCGACGTKMTTTYHPSQRGDRSLPHYRCVAKRAYGSTGCLSIAASTVDRLAVRGVLAAVAALSEDVLEEAIRQLTGGTELQASALRSQRDEARRRAERARQRYLAVDPDNRHVSRALEKEFEEALAKFEETRARVEVELTALPAPPSSTEVQQLRQIADDFPTVWEAPSTKNEDRKEIIRLLLTDVRLRRVDEFFSELELVWTTGLAQQIRLVSHGKLVQLEKALLDQGLPPDQIAEMLNAEGLRSRAGDGARPFDARLVTANLQSKFDLSFDTWVGRRALILHLHDEKGLTPTEIGEELNRRGLTNQRGAPYNRTAVIALLHHHGRRVSNRVPTALVKKLYDTGLSPSEIAAELQRQGIRTLRGRPYSVAAVYDRLAALGIRPDRVRRQVITELAERGLSPKEVANELRARGMRTKRGRQYTRQAAWKIVRDIQGRREGNSPAQGSGTARG